MSATIDQAQREKVFYPDSDGQPMAENALQFKWIVLVKEGLEAVFRDDPNVFVAGDLLWYAQEGDPTIRVAPDAMVVFGRPKGHRGSYKQWEENGIAPQVVFEIQSPGNRFGEMLRKFRFYDERGVEEYYLYDPDTGELEGWRREEGRLREIPEMKGWVSPLLGIRFDPGEGPDDLKIYGPDGSRFRTPQEILEDEEALKRRAEAERQRAEEAEKRAETERQRAERLAARLRELGESID